MKRISYTYACEVNRGTEEEPDVETITNDKIIECDNARLEPNLSIAEKEAVPGTVKVEDLPDPPPTREEKNEAQLTYTAMMTDTLLPEEDSEDV